MRLTTTQIRNRLDKLKAAREEEERGRTHRLVVDEIKPGEEPPPLLVDKSIPHLRIFSTKPDPDDATWVEPIVTPPSIGD